MKKGFTLLTESDSYQTFLKEECIVLSNLSKRF